MFRLVLEPTRKIMLVIFCTNAQALDPALGAQRRNRVKCSSKGGHVNSRRGSGPSSRAFFAAYSASLSALILSRADWFAKSK